MLNVVFPLIAEPVPSVREPLEMRDFISSLTSALTITVVLYCRQRNGKGHLLARELLPRLIPLAFYCPCSPAASICFILISVDCITPLHVDF